MGRKNSQFESDQELSNLIAQYEAMKAENRSHYMDADQLADIADTYATNSRTDEAQEVITYGLGLHPGNTDLLIEQAYLYIDTQQLLLANEVADSIKETFPIEVKMLKVELLLQGGRPDEAEAILDTIDDDDKEDLSTVVEIARVYFDMGYPEKGLPWIERNISQHGDDEEFLISLTECYCAIGMDEEAIPYYNKLIDIDPYFPCYWMGLSKCYFVKKEYEKALEAIEFALASDEEYGDGHTMKAHCLFHLENEDEAIEEFLKSLKYKGLAPEYAYLFIGLAYSNKEEWQQSYDSHQKAIQAIESEKSPLLVDLYSNQATALSQLEKYEEAHQRLALAKEIDADNAELYLSEGRIYADEDNFDAAKKEWVKALRLSPSAETWHSIGTSSLEFSLPEEARMCFEHVRELDPDFENINEQLVSVCLMLADHEGFAKYNKLCKEPIDFLGMLDFFEQQRGGANEILQDLRKFLNSIEENTKDEDEEYDDDNDDDAASQSNEKNVKL